MLLTVQTEAQHGVGVVQMPLKRGARDIFQVGLVGGPSLNDVLTCQNYNC
jgi:hypothetical protein